MRGKLIVGALSVVLAAGAVAVAVNAGSRDGDRVRTTQIIIKEAERDLVQRRMQTDHYPRSVQPEPVDGWGHPMQFAGRSRSGLCHDQAARPP